MPFESSIYLCSNTMDSEAVKLATRSFIIVWMSSIVFVQVVVGVPLPFRENQGMGGFPSQHLQPPLETQSFKHTHHYTNSYHRSDSTNDFHETEFSSRNGRPNGSGRLNRHNEVHFAPPNDHHHYQNSYHNRHQSHQQYQSHQDRRYDHQPMDLNQHHSMEYHHHQYQQQPLGSQPNVHDFRESSSQPLHMNHHEGDTTFHGSNENNVRSKRDANAPNIVQFHYEWQPDQNEKSSSMLLSPNDAPVGYCTNPECVQRLAGNNIRRPESSNKYAYDEVSSKVQDPIKYSGNSNGIQGANNPPRVVQISLDQNTHYGRSSRGEDRHPDSNNKIPLPSRMLTPPASAVPGAGPSAWSNGAEIGNERGLNFLQQQNNHRPVEDFGQFYGQYPQQPPANYLDFPDVHSIPHPFGQHEINSRDSFPLDNSWNESNPFFATTTAGTKSSTVNSDASESSPDVIRMSASSISIRPDGLEILKVVLDFSNEDDEETHLEVEDQY